MAPELTVILLLCPKSRGCVCMCVWGLSVFLSQAGGRFINKQRLLSISHEDGERESKDVSG